MPDPYPLIDREPVDGQLPNPSVWELLSQIEFDLRGTWVLVGGLMVLLHGLEAGHLPRRETADADALVNVRLRPRATRDLSEWLLDAGLEFEGSSVTGTGHRFSNEVVTVDVLAPDNLGERADTRTVPPHHTVQIPAGTRLLRDAALCPIRLDPDTIGYVPRPSLTAAIVGKAAALRLDDAKRHAEDLAFLLGLVPDPREVVARLSKSDLRHINRAKTLLGDNRIWTYSHDPDVARSTLTFLIAG
ncbi:MAG: hypothetical protein ABFR89_12235 [Actinomycetota bacterium]